MSSDRVSLSVAGIGYNLPLAEEQFMSVNALPVIVGARRVIALAYRHHLIHLEESAEGQAKSLNLPINPHFSQ